jgi:site-specific DNA recombinase
VDRILHEEAYIGTYYYNRKHCVPIEGAYGKKRQRFKCTLRPKEEWIPISVPPIIDLATFHAAAGRARENEAFSPRNLQEGGYLLRKLVRCGRCGCSCSALTSKQTYGGKVHSSHYYGCLRTTSGFLKQERCSQRRIRADVLDELVWEEVSTRLQDPALVMEAYQDHKTQRRDPSNQDGTTEKDERLKDQIKLVNKELARLLDAYQYGALELPELQKRRQLVNSKLEVLNREQELLRKMAAEKKKETDIKASLGEFAALVSTNLKRISFENKQKLLRMVLDKVVVNEWRVDVHYNIPLPKPAPTPEQKVSTKFDLRSTCIWFQTMSCDAGVHWF